MTSYTTARQAQPHTMLSGKYPAILKENLSFEVINIQNLYISFSSMTVKITGFSIFQNK
jgi:hypothetical protein